MHSQWGCYHLQGSKKLVFGGGKKIFLFLCIKHKYTYIDVNQRYTQYKTDGMKILWWVIMKIISKMALGGRAE